MNETSRRLNGRYHCGARPITPLLARPKTEKISCLGHFFQMTQGYQIIEPSSLEKLIRNPSQADIAVAILNWVVAKLKLESPQLFDEVRLEVIGVSYLGAYPAIGILYSSKVGRDLGQDISSAIDAIVESARLGDFMSFAEGSSTNWCDTWQRLKKEGK